MLYRIVQNHLEVVRTQRWRQAGLLTQRVSLREFDAFEMEKGVSNRLSLIFTMLILLIFIYY